MHWCMTSTAVPAPASADRRGTIHRCSAPSFNNGSYQATFRAARHSSFRAILRANPLSGVNAVVVKIGGRFIACGAGSWLAITNARLAGASRFLAFIREPFALDLAIGASIRPDGARMDNRPVCSGRSRDVRHSARPWIKKRLFSSTRTAASGTGSRNIAHGFPRRQIAGMTGGNQSGRIHRASQAMPLQRTQVLFRNLLLEAPRPSSLSRTWFRSRVLRRAGAVRRGGRRGGRRWRVVR
jgi:hypothetical protein